jgi:hypothetical protein
MMRNRTIGLCRADGVDIQAEMVRAGMAWAFVRFSHDYVEQESAARAERLGVHAHDCQRHGSGGRRGAANSGCWRTDKPPSLRAPIPQGGSVSRSGSAFGPLALPAIHRVVTLPVAPYHIELAPEGFFHDKR